MLQAPTFTLDCFADAYALAKNTDAVLSNEKQKEMAKFVLFSEQFGCADSARINHYATNDLAYSEFSAIHADSMTKMNDLTDTADGGHSRIELGLYAPCEFTSYYDSEDKPSNNSALLMGSSTHLYDFNECIELLESSEQSLLKEIIDIAQLSLVHGTGDVFWESAMECFCGYSLEMTEVLIDEGFTHANQQVIEFLMNDYGEYELEHIDDMFNLYSQWKDLGFSSDRKRTKHAQSPFKAMIKVKWRCLNTLKSASPLMTQLLKPTIAVINAIQSVYQDESWSIDRQELYQNSILVSDENELDLALSTPIATEKFHLNIVDEYSEAVMQQSEEFCLAIDLDSGNKIDLINNIKRQIDTTSLITQWLEDLMALFQQEDNRNART